MDDDEFLKVVAEVMKRADWPHLDGLQHMKQAIDARRMALSSKSILENGTGV